MPAVYLPMLRCRAIQQSASATANGSLFVSNYSAARVRTLVQRDDSSGFFALRSNKRAL